MEDELKNWKLKLRYGKLTTPYRHFTAITKGMVQEKSSYSPGNAFMGLKLWATDYEAAADLVEEVAARVGFAVTGAIEIFDTPPEEPPRPEPYGYGLNFTYFQK